MPASREGFDHQEPLIGAVRFSRSRRWRGHCVVPPLQGHRQLTHRDIKPQNIILVKGQPKLGMPSRRHQALCIGGGHACGTQRRAPNASL
jgi:hypothetical protein